MPPAVTTVASHSLAPSSAAEALIELAARHGCGGVELAVSAGFAPERALEAARSNGVRIVTLGTVAGFNRASPDVLAEIERLVRAAAGCGAEAVSLLPVSDGSGRGNGERQGTLRLVLRALKPLLAQHGVQAFVAPLGRAEASLRSAEEIVAAIDGTQAGDHVRLVHDLSEAAGSDAPRFLPGRTGLVRLPVDDSAAAEQVATLSRAPRRRAWSS